MPRSARCGIGMLTLAATFALGASSSAAQWRLDLQAGRLTYEGLEDEAMSSLAVGVTRATAVSTLGLSAGVPLAQEEPLWAALYGQRRIEAGSTLRFGVDLAGDAFAYRIASPDTFGRLLPLPREVEPLTGWGGAAEVMPFVARALGPFSAELRAGGVGIVSSATEGASFDRLAFVSDAALRFDALPGLELGVDGRVVDVSEGTFPFVGASASWTRGVTLWGSVGRWLDDAIESVAWDAGASLPLGTRAAFFVSGGHDPIDPVYDTPARTTWGLGFSLRLGSGGSIAEPIPSDYANGIATIALEDDDVDGTPSVAGDFNDWTPQPMTREGGDWVFRVPLEPGVYNYAFVDGDGDWFVPEDTPGRRDDGMGGWVAVLVIQE